MKPPNGRSRQESDLVSLVLRSALSADTEAHVAWAEICAREDIDMWPNELIRPLPLIFRRFKSHPTTPHLSLLRGIARSTWATNIMRIQRALPVLESLENQQITYRLIKGAAVCSYLGSWGSRRMGDVDLVVPLNNSLQVRAALGEAGFEERSPNSLPSGLWEDGRGGLLDLHWASPAEVDLQTILGSAGIHVRVLDQRVGIPTPETLAAIAIQHASKGFAASDYIQGLIDLDQLLPHCDVTQLRASLADLEVWEAADQMLFELRGLNSSRASTFPPLGPAPARRRARIRRLKKTTSNIRRGLRILQARSLAPWHLVHAVPGLWKRPIYLAWLSAGQFRPIEKVVIRKFGGFLPSPQAPVLVNDQILIDAQSTMQHDRHLSSVQVPGVERRWRIRVIPRTSLRVDLTSTTEHRETPRLLFINGELHGFFPPEGVTHARIEIRQPTELLEFSLRLIPGSTQPDAPLELSLREMAT